MNPLQQRVETLLKDRTVAWRVQALSRATIVALVVLGVLYATVAAVTYLSDRDLANYNRYNAAVNELQVGMLQARRAEKDFYLRRDAEYVGRHDKIVDKIDETVSRLTAEAPTAEFSDKMPAIRTALENYRTAFNLSATLLIDAGLNQDSGRHGAMRKSARALEQLVDDKPELEVSLLRLRRHEKDFIQREDVSYHARFLTERRTFNEILSQAKLSPEVREKTEAAAGEYFKVFDDFVVSTMDAAEEAKSARDAARETEPVTEAFGKLIDERLAQGVARNALIRTVAGAFFALLLIAIGVGLVFLTNTLATSIRRPLEHLTGVVEEMSKGNEDVRSRMEGKDELNEFGRALDQLLDGRIEVQRAIEKENEELNDSVLNLLQAVAVLAKRDLTHKVPVTEDVTGPVADALNLLTRETAKTLRQVSDLSAEVTTASLSVRETGEAAMNVAEKERVEVEATAVALNETVAAMARIATLAQVCNQAADSATQTTREALETVNTTVTGINATRDTIRETEKRIKRLGERSQEISQAVSLIGSVAERTHILALNASMHAASAGEAGRGFAVVADEVQRLAENARQATQQIASLVNNIQTDTADAVTAMNTAIEQVVSGSRLAERAGEQMQVTAKNTDDLVRSVQQIAQSSGEQAKAGRTLLTRADAIRRSTQETNQKLQEQAAQTESLVQFAGGLLSAVRVFKLPE